VSGSTFREKHQTFADLLRPLVGEDERAALAVNLSNEHSAVVLEAPRHREAESVDIKAERGLNARDVKHRAGEPLGHGRDGAASSFDVLRQSMDYRPL
jgi:hypothetical protein